LFFVLLYIEEIQPKGVKMHGQQTMKYLNDKAVADAIMAKNKDNQNVDPAFAKAVEEALAAKAKNITA
jgi:hypothetical protein